MQLAVCYFKSFQPQMKMKSLLPYAAACTAKRFGFTASTSLSEGLDRAIAWYQAQRAAPLAA